MQGLVSIGPVTTVAQVLAAYPKDHPAYRPMPEGSKTPVLGEQEWLVDPTPEALHNRAMELLDAADKEKEKAKNLEGGQKEKGEAEQTKEG